MRSVPLIRCLTKMSPSSSISTGSQIATWRRCLTWTRHEFSYDLRPPSTGKMFVWPPAFLSEPGSAPYSSAPSLTTVWSNYQISYNQQSAMMETDAGTCASISVSLSTTSSRLSNHFLLYTPIDLQFRLYQQSNQTSHSDQPKIYQTDFYILQHTLYYYYCDIHSKLLCSNVASSLLWIAQ